MTNGLKGPLPRAVVVERSVDKPAQSEHFAAAPERGNVINLMDALKASLSQAKPPAKSKSKAEAEPAVAKPALKAAAGGGGGRAAAAKPAARASKK